MTRVTQHAIRAATAALFALAMASPTIAQTLTIGGTGSALGTMKLLAAEFARASPGVGFNVVPSLGTSGGVKAVIAAAIDIAVLARPLKADEAAKGLVGVAYGLTPLVLATPLTGATGIKDAGDVVAMYNGSRATWPSGEPVRLIMRPVHDIDFIMLRALSPALQAALDAAAARPGLYVSLTDQEHADALEKTPGAFGTTTLSVILSERRKLAIVPLNGVMPTEEAVANGTYPAVKQMYAVRRTDSKPVAAAFIEFMRSPAASRILKETGHTQPSARR